MSQDQELRKASFHEAGHAVAYWYAGSRLRSVSITTKGEGTTIANHPIVKVLHKISWDTPAMKSWILCLLAGPAAEMYADFKISGRVPPQIYDDLEYGLQSMCARGFNPAKGYSCDDFFREYGQAAKIFTVSHWQKIKTLADLLLEKRQMSGQEVARFLEDIWPEALPDGVLRYQEHKKGEKL